MELIEVSTGEVSVYKGDAEIISNALGSCIAVVMYDNTVQAGGIAHIMLPDTAPTGTPDEYLLRYAKNGIDHLLFLLKKDGAQNRFLKVLVAGGGNVLNLPDDTLCESNIKSVLDILAYYKIVPDFSFLGSNIRRRVRLNLKTGSFFCAEGDGKEIEVSDSVSFRMK